jgi:hypothetical protein
MAGNREAAVSALEATVTLIETTADFAGGSSFFVPLGAGAPIAIGFTFG